MRARVGAVYQHGMGQAHTQMSLGLFPLGASRAKGRAPSSIEATTRRSGSDTTNARMKTKRGGCARADSEGTLYEALNVRRITTFYDKP